MDFTTIEKVVGAILGTVGISTAVSKFFHRNVHKQIESALLKHNQDMTPHQNTIVGRQRCDTLHAELNDKMERQSADIEGIKHDVSWIRSFLQNGGGKRYAKPD